MDHVSTKINADQVFTFHAVSPVCRSPLQAPNRKLLLNDVLP